MISDYDNKYNRVSKLERSKWTSLKRLNGYNHYEVIKIDKKRNKIELFSVCEKEKRVTVKKEDLKNKSLWVRGWNSKMNKNKSLSLKDKLVDGTISRVQAAGEVRQIIRRKAEQRLLDNSNEKKNCYNCSKEFNVMYRVQFDCSKEWVFICKSCLEKLKPNNPHYRYGGTWKK